MNTTTIKARILDLQADGMTTAKIKAFLTIEDYSAKDITAAFKELGVTTKPKTFASDYYNWLATEQRTEAEALSYIAGDGEFGETSKNVQAHKSHYLNICELSRVIWNQAGSPAEETDEQIEIKAAWVFHKKMTAKLDKGAKLTKAEKAKAHPDKISYLNDTKLTEAYNELSKRAA
tara:strand:- start:27867 stop:28394 length:528 start_codon:yes stop_codon:yes gene_type:complete